MDIKLNYKLPLLVILLVLVVGIPYCFLGFDVTDTGFHLYEQQRMFHAGFHAFLNDFQYPLSHYLGGLLQKISITGSLLEMRFICVLMYCVCVWLTFAIVQEFQEFENNSQAKKTAVIIFSFFLMAFNPFSAGPIVLVYYDNIPMILCLLLVLLLVKFLKSRNLVYLFLSYLVFAALVLSKITLITALILFVIIFIQNIFRKRQKISEGILLSLGSIMVCTYVWFFRHQSVELAPNYEYHQLIHVYVVCLIKSLPIIFGMVILMVIGFLFEKRKSIYFTIALVLIGLFILKKLFGSYSNPKDLSFIGTAKYVFFYSCTLALMFYSLFLLFWKRDMNSIKVFLFLAAGFLPCFVDFGTDGGLRKLGFGVWLMPPLIYLYLDKKNKFLASAFFKISILIGVLGIFNLYTSFYRDLDNPFKLDSTFHYPKLNYIYTFPERRNAYQELLDASEKYIKKDDKVFAYESNGMFYWVTGTVAFQDLTWPDMFTLHQLTEKMSAICKTENDSPKIIVKTIASTRNKSWPLATSTMNAQYEEKQQMINQTILENCKPSKVWSNSSFEIWVPGTL